MYMRVYISLYVCIIQYFPKQLLFHFTFMNPEAWFSLDLLLLAGSKARGRGAVGCLFFFENPVYHWPFQGVSSFVKTGAPSEVDQGFVRTRMCPS